MNRTAFLSIIFSLSIYVSNAQSFLLKEGEKSTTLPFSFDSDFGEPIIGLGYVHSQNGKYDLGIKVSVLPSSPSFFLFPFYRYYFYNDPNPEGMVLSGTVGYGLFIDADGDTRSTALLSPRIQYRIPTKSLIITPEIEYNYVRVLDVNASGSSYGAAINVSSRTEKGYITIIPRIAWNDNDFDYAIGLNWQWLR